MIVNLMVNLSSFLGLSVVNVIVFVITQFLVSKGLIFALKCFHSKVKKNSDNFIVNPA